MTRILVLGGLFNVSRSDLSAESTAHSDSVTVVTDDSTAPSSSFQAARKNLSDRFLKPKKTPTTTPTDQPEFLPFNKRLAAMKALETSEVRFGYGVAILSFIFTLGLNVPYLFGVSQYTTTQKPVNGHCAKDFFLIKGQCSQTLIYHPIDYVPFLVTELILALAVLVTIRMKRRVPATFTSLLMGLVIASQPPIKSFILGAPFWIYGGWLLLRARRLQKFGTTDAKLIAGITAEIRAAKKDGTAMPPQIATRQDLVNADKSSPRGGGKPGKPGTGGAKAVDTPEPSKRYTPKKPAPKRPTPPPAEPKPSRFRKLIGDDEPTTN